ncbi:hypothetical protein F7D31_09415 [Prevotella copri]|uniref:Uncharacterized protein n=1 Tax=Segatella copri TaxID=165179 RepID=A0AA90VMY5_9BACT|nr:hypothetical protein [Segatella copri]
MNSCEFLFSICLLLCLCSLLLQSCLLLSIPYLDNIIEVSLSILKKHDPGHNDPVNFNSLIDML